MSLPDSGLWIQLDERDVVAGSIRHALVCHELVKSDHVAWKWLILALHSGLQEACVCHLSTTASPIGPLTDKNTREWIDWLSGTTPHDAGPPKTRLAELPELLKRIRKDGCAGDQQSGSAIQVSDAELNHLIHIHKEVRNQFIHYEPVSWSLDVSGLSLITPLVVRIVVDILNYGWAFRLESAEWICQLKEDLQKLTDASHRLHVEHR